MRTLDEHLESAAVSLGRIEESIPPFATVRRRSRIRRAFRVVASLTAALLIVGIVATEVGTSKRGSLDVTGTSSTLATSSTTTVTPSTFPAPGTVYQRDGITLVQVFGQVELPVEHIGTYEWTSDLVMVSPSVWKLLGAVGPNREPAAFSAAYHPSPDVRIGTMREMPVVDGDKVGLRVTFSVISFKPGAHIRLDGGNVQGPCSIC